MADSDAHAWGWRGHTQRDSGPRAPTIGEWLAENGKHRHSRQTGIFASEVDRFASVKPNSKAEFHFNSAQDQKTWMATAREISHLGRSEMPAATNSNHAYLGIDAPDTISDRAQIKSGALPGCQAVFDSRCPARPVPPVAPRDTQAPGWRHHTTRDSGPKQPTISEHVKHEARFRSDRRHAFFQSTVDRFRLRSFSEQLLLEQRNALQPRIPGEGHSIGGVIPRERPRFKVKPPLPSDRKDGGVLFNDNYKLADDSKVWQQGARTINPKGRENKDHAANPNISYLGEHPPESIGLRASSDGPPGCKPVFQSAVPRFGAPDPSFPGPGHYDITDPVDWQRHDKVIKLDTHLFKVRPSHQFELPKVKPLLNNKKEQPGPGWYETQRRQQTGEAPSAPAWQPVASEQVQTCDKSPPSHFKLADDSSVWSSAGRAAARTMSGAVRSRFETAGGGTQHIVPSSNRSEAVNSRQLREFCSARERGEKMLTRQAASLGDTARSSTLDGGLEELEAEKETAYLLRALRQQSLRNVRTPRTVRRQRESDVARSSPRGHTLVQPRFKLPTLATS